MPVGVHGLDDAADDEFAAFSATGGKENVEVMLAVLAALEFVKDAVAELLEALGAPRKLRHWFKVYEVICTMEKNM